jgi:hypothetical protein
MPKCSFLGIVAITATPWIATANVNFARDIQPILERSCFGCHGAKVQMAGLRLDAKGASSRVIVPGNATLSPLYKRITGIGGLARMPMGGQPLATDQIALIRQWIDEGAEWPEAGNGAAVDVKRHWAFVSPARPAVPLVRNFAWTRNAIDSFVLARLEREGLKPSPEADKVTLLRRLSLDLIGLPPTIEEVDAFLRDQSPKSYEKQVERLLSSPHYGERWGRHWLDAARYADSNGFEKDRPRVVWPYRDWVIRAANRDLPYDQFIIQQIAGDLLPERTQDQLVATGFLRNSMLNEEGGIDPEQFRMEAIFDRMDAIGKGILGITIQCAQCHNHKFDPLTQEEYYRMFAFLNDTHEASVAVYTPREQMTRAEILRRAGEMEADLRHRYPDWRDRMAQWERKVEHDQPEWTVLRPEVDAISSSGQKYLPQEDGSFLAQGTAPARHRVKMTVTTDVQHVTAFRLELLTDPNLPLGGPGRAGNGNCALTEFEVEAAPADEPQRRTKVKFSRATADISLPERPLSIYLNENTKERLVVGPVEFAIDGNRKTAWGIDAGPGLRNEARKAVFTAEEPIAHAKGTLLTFYLAQNHGGFINSEPGTINNLGRFRISITTAPEAVADPLPKKARDILSIPPEQRTTAQVDTVFRYWRTTVPQWREPNQRIAALWRDYPEGISQLVLAARKESRKTRMLMRGDFLQQGKEVTTGVPAFLHPLPAGASPDRLTFAKWLVDRSSPTTARAFVNRMWQAYFGTGIIATSEDLGQQSDPPSHPQLLDWLAVEFMDRGWSMKAMHRLIVTSATYRQSSRVTPESYARDPYNRLLARGPRFRVEAEIVRDIALAASGLLNPEVGGPSVFPPAPAFLFVPPASYAPKVWNESAGAERYRRGLYTFRYRSVPYPMLQTFDAPSGETSCVRRARSNTPLQALTTLNEPVFMECARSLALRAVREGGNTDRDRLSYVFRRCLARRPTEAESAELLRLLDRQIDLFSGKTRDSRELAAEDRGAQPELPAGITQAELAGWTSVSRVLLNLDETITKE